MKEILAAINNFLWVIKNIGRRNQILFFVALLMVISVAAITAYIPEKIGQLVDNFDNSGFPIQGLTIIGLLYLIKEVSDYVKKYCVEKASTDAWNRLTLMNTNHLLHVDQKWLKDQELGGLNARFQRSIQGAVRLLKISFMDLVPAMVLMIFAIFVALTNSLIVGAVIGFVIPIAFYIIHHQIDSQKGIRISLNRAIESIQAKLIEMLHGIDTIRSLNFEEKQLQKISSHSLYVKETEFKHHKDMMRFDALKGFNKAFWQLAVLVLSLFLLNVDQITIGQVFTFLLLFNNVIQPLEEFHRFLDESSEASLLTSDLIDIMEVPKDEIYRKNAADEYSLQQNKQPLIKVSDYSFGYNGVDIIKDVSLNLETGKFYGIVGESGCGKSTLIKNVIGFYFGSGELNFNGSKLCDLSRELVAKKIAYLPQKPFIISGSIRENLLFGCKWEPSEGEIIKAAQKAQIINLIKNSESGLDTKISPSGNNLSGGEAQRICLTRIFLNKSCDLIILDESTSALDNITEDLVYENLLELTQEGKTVVSIAHRLDTLKKSDAIFVMDNGEIAQEGTYFELESSDGAFRNLLLRDAQVEY